MRCFFLWHAWCNFILEASARFFNTSDGSSRLLLFFCSITTAAWFNFFCFSSGINNEFDISGLSNYDHDEVYSCVALYVHALRLSLAYSSGSLWRIALSHNCGECVMSLSSLCGVRRKLESGWEGSRWKFPVSFWRININMCSVCWAILESRNIFFSNLRTMSTHASAIIRYVQLWWLYDDTTLEYTIDDTFCLPSSLPPLTYFFPPWACN